MESRLLFTEKQWFRQWWIRLILFGINGLFLYGTFQQVICGKQFGDRPMNDTGLIMATVFVILFSIFFFNLRLETIIKTDGIYVRFFPLHRSFRYYSWSKISKAYVRQYNPLKEYGGWGWRIGLFGKGQAYNVSGDMGLQLELYNNDKLLIGTNKPDELINLLNKQDKK